MMKPTQRKQMDSKCADNNIQLKNTVSKKCQKMRRYRQNVKSDPERLERMRAKDRERKREQREKLKEAIRSGNRKLEDTLRTKNTEYVRKYRKNKKLKQKEQKPAANKEKVLPKSYINMKKEIAKLRTQKWKMKIKLARMTDEISSDAAEGSSEVNSPDALKGTELSRWTIYRRTKQMKESLPKMPEKRISITEKIINSPTTSSLLTAKGKIVTGQAKKKSELAETVVNE